jgi:multidrug efflux pump subunit AcrA (membrane-fusion protein)
MVSSTSRSNRFIPSRLLSATLLISVLVGSCSSAPEAQAPPPTPVQLQPVKTSTVQDSSEFVGALEAQNRVELRPEVEGRIVQILVSPGQSVASGEVIAELKTDRNAAQVSGASADVSAAQAAVSTAEAEVQSAKADVAQSRAQAESAAADVKLQETDYRRIDSLVQEGAQAVQARDQAVNRRDTALAALKAAQEQVRANEEQVRAAEASREEARARFSSSQAARNVAATDLDNNLVKAPIAGIVGDVPAKVGDYAQTDTTITTIIQNSSLELNLSVPIERTPKLRTGLPVELLDDQGKRLATGQVTFISPQVNNTQQAVLAKASFPSNGRLKDGQFVRARVIWETSPGILVPTGAVARIAGQTFVYVAAQGSAAKPGESPAASPAENQPSGQPQQVAQQRLVKLGNIQGNNYQVLEGLKPGEQVVVTGILNLQDGSPISIAQSQPTDAPKPQ